MDTHSEDENISLLDPDVAIAYEKSANITFEREDLPNRRGVTLFPVVSLPDGIEKKEINETEARGYLYKRTTTNSLNERKLPGLMFFHGGGYMSGDPNSVQRYASAVMPENNCVFFSPRYRFCPEDPYPAALEDAIKALQWFSALPEVDESSIIVGGISAGGGLTAALALTARENPALPRIAAMLLEQPYVSTEPIKSGPYFEKVWSRKDMKSSLEWYTPNEEQRNDGIAWPLLASSLANLPPAIISVAQYDILRESSMKFAMRLSSESVNGCEIHVWKGSIHGGPSMAPTAPVHVAQMDALVRFVNDIWYRIPQAAEARKKAN